MLAPKGLNIGDTFKDEMGLRKVIGFTEVNYVKYYNTVLVTEETEKAPIVEQKSEETSTEVDYDSMSLKELQNLCKERGLAIRGSKQDVIDRLRG